MNITENLNRIQQAKSDIRAAIIQKGGTVSEGAKIDEYASAVGSIPAGGDDTFDIEMKYEGITSAWDNVYYKWNKQPLYQIMKFEYSFDGTNYTKLDIGDDSIININIYRNVNFYIRFNYVKLNTYYTESSAHSNVNFNYLQGNSVSVDNFTIRLNKVHVFSSNHLLAMLPNGYKNINIIINPKDDVVGYGAFRNLCYRNVSVNRQQEQNINVRLENIKELGTYAFTDAFGRSMLHIRNMNFDLGECVKFGDSCFLNLFEESNNNYGKYIDLKKLEGFEIPDNAQIGASCFKGMFMYTYIEEPIQIDVTTLANSCYENMYRYCIRLVQAPDLPATTLANNCYQNMFQGCTSLQKTGKIYATGNISSAAANMFSDCTSLGEMTWMATTPPTINANIWTNCPSDMIIRVPSEAVNAYKAASVWSSRAACILPIEPIKNAILTSYNPVTIKSFTKNFNVECVFELEAEDGTKLNSNKTYNLTTDENLGDESVSKNFDIEFLGFNFTITITQTANDHQTITNVENYGTYGFYLNGNGYYESNNKGKSSSFAYATVTFVPQSDSVTFECINSGESGYDYGIISQLNQVLAKSTSGDTSTTLVKKSFKDLSSLNPVDVVYDGLTVGETYTITVKFRKDANGDQGNDSFQFRVKGE